MLCHTCAKSLHSLGPKVASMVVHAVLYSADGTKDMSFAEIDSLYNDPRYRVYAEQIRARPLLGLETSDNIHERLLDGTVVSSSYLLTDHFGNRGVYFVFEDLSVKMDDTFRLKFFLSELNE